MGLNDEREKVRHAVDVVARHVLAYTLDRVRLQRLYGTQDDFPELGANSWREVVSQINHLTSRLAQPPPAEEFYAAYDFLASRAGDPS